MLVKRHDLVRAMESVKPGLGKKAGDQSPCFVFSEGRVFACNDEVVVSCPVEDLEIEGAVRAEELLEYLRRVEGEEVEVEAVEGELRIKAGSSKAGLSFQDQEDVGGQLQFFFEEEVDHRRDWKRLPRSFVEALRFVMFSCARDESYPVLNCVNVRRDGWIEASDNFRIARYNVRRVPVDDFLLPLKYVKELVKYEVERVSRGDRWVHFLCKGGAEFSCRMLDEVFPKVDDLVEVEGPLIRLPESIGEILSRAEVFAGEDYGSDGEVEVSLKDKRMVIKGRSEVGWYEEVAEASYDGDPISFRVNPSLLREIVNETKECVYGGDRLRFQGDKWEYVTSLYVIEG